MPHPSSSQNSNTGAADPGLHVGRPFWASDQTGLVQGPSSSESPYLVSLDPHVSLTAIATVGDDLPSADADYAFSGLLDGLGAFDNGDGTFTLLANHEISPGLGDVQDHGSTGAFVSELVIDKKTLAVVDAHDLIQTVHLWNDATGAYEVGTAAFNRFCSGDLPSASAIYNAASGLGYGDGLIYFNGEETADGRAFAHIASGPEAGETYELPWLGRLAFENVVASPNSGDKTVVMLTDDTTPGQVYVYIGDKQDHGNAVEKAGLVGGKLYAVQVVDAEGHALNEDRLTAFGAGTDSDRDGNAEYHFKLVEIAGDAGENITLMNGAQVEADSNSAGATKFLRPEDGAWDTQDPNGFYFVTTDRFDTIKAETGDTAGRSRLWDLKFDDLDNPTAGGHIEMMLDGTEPQQMMDNITVNRAGQVLIEEDPGNQDYLAKVWIYDPGSDSLTLLAQHDPARFLPGAADFLTKDEESSGILDLSSILGRGNKDVYLLDVQAHYGNGSSLVEGGQLLGMQVDFRGGWLA